MNFNELGLSDRLLKAVSDMGFEIPTPIQEKIIPHILNEKNDIVGLAQTGTGKTAAFGLPILEKMNFKKNNVQTLILCPTRELCLQITNDFESFAKYIPDVSITAVYGGSGMIQQINSVKKGTHVIIATPGRLLDLIKRKVADISTIHYLVLDEADIMLNMGFKEELDAILEKAPLNRQTMLFSATMPEDVAKIATNYMKETIEITVGKKNSGTESVEHKYFLVHAKDKYLALKRIVDFYPEIYGIIFCRTRISTQEVADNMIKDGYNAEPLHGDLSQSQREYVMRKFREKNLQLLVATDIAARGLDVNNLTHIIHYDLPSELNIYTHRSGRTGRAGKTGISISIINIKEKHKVKMIEKTVKRKLVEERMPIGKDICAQQLLHLIDRVKSVKVDNEQISPHMDVIEEKLAALDREELLKHFVSLEFNRFLDYYKNTPDLKPMMRESEKKDFNKTIGHNAGFTYITINLGREDRILPLQLIGLINQLTSNRNIKLGNIDINEDKSRIQIENRHLEEVYDALNDYKFKGKTLHIEIDQKKGGAEEQTTEERGGRRRERGRRTNNEEQTTEERGGRTRERGRRTNNEKQTTEERGGRTRERGRRTNNEKQTTEERGGRTRERGRRTNNEEQTTEERGGRTRERGRRTNNEEQTTEERGGRTRERGRRTNNEKQTTEERGGRTRERGRRTNNKGEKKRKE